MPEKWITNANPHTASGKAHADAVVFHLLATTVRVLPDNSCFRLQSSNFWGYLTCWGVCLNNTYIQDDRKTDYFIIATFIFTSVSDNCQPRMILVGKDVLLGQYHIKRHKDLSHNLHIVRPSPSQRLIWADNTFPSLPVTHTHTYTYTQRIALKNYVKLLLVFPWIDKERQGDTGELHWWL